MFQEEVGESGTYHWQGYVEMTRPVRPTHFKKTCLEGAHIEIARAPDAADDYAQKDETRVGGPYIFGVRATGQGQRSDLIALRDAVRDGKRGRALFDDDALAGSCIKFSRGLSAMESAYAPPPMRREHIRVVLHFGPPGTGKSHCAACDGAYYFDGDANSNGFWLGYTGQSTLIFDDFGGHLMRPLMWQRLCDKYPLTVNVKGGEVSCAVTNVHICTNRLPGDWWSARTAVVDDAIYRRIHEVHYHDRYKHYFRFESTGDEGNSDDRSTWAVTKFLAKYRELNPVVNIPVHTGKVQDLL